VYDWLVLWFLDPPQRFDIAIKTMEQLKLDHFEKKDNYTSLAKVPAGGIPGDVPGAKFIWHCSHGN
jgi:hypothetical protein